MNPLTRIREHKGALRLLEIAGVEDPTLIGGVTEVLQLFGRQSEAIKAMQAKDAPDAVFTYLIPYHYNHTSQFNGGSLISGEGFQTVTVPGGIREPSQINEITTFIKGLAVMSEKPNLKVIPSGFFEINRKAKA